MAVYITEVPEHIVPDGLAAMVTEGVTAGLTVIVITFDVTDAEGLGHAAFDVKIQVTICPFVNVPEVYVGLFAPTLLPFTCH